MLKAMIDTVVLTIPKEALRLTSTSWDLHSKSGHYQKFVKNQTSSQKKDGIYRPRVRAIQRGRTAFIQIEFSVPKLIKGNNVDEVSESDFGTIITTLQTRLKDFGMYIFEPQLRKASISVFHPSKNVVLSGGYTVSGILKELHKINLTKKMDLNRDSFRNDGESLQCYSNSHSLVIYDKARDLRKPSKRAVDKDQTPSQLSLFHNLKTNSLIEILRIEVRLSSKQKMNSVLKKNGFARNPTFEEVFKKEVCQKIVEHYWKSLIENSNLFLFSLTTNPKQVMRSLMQNNPTLKPKEIIYLVGLESLCRDENGIRELRSYVERFSSLRSWYRIADGFNHLNSGRLLSNSHGWTSQVESQLKAFESLKIDPLLVKNCKA